MLARITPVKLWWAFAVAAVTGAAYHAVRHFYPGTRLVSLWSSGGQLLDALAYLIVLVLCLKIRADYPAPSKMRMAWLQMAGCAAISIVRHGFEALSRLNGWTDTRLTTLVSLRQIPIVLALVLLTAGLVAMWSSFVEIGLGLRFRWSDLGLAAATVGLVAWIFSLRAGMSDAGSVYPLIRLFQSASPLLLAAPALAGLALHRISREMGGGPLAVSLRYMVAFLLLRLLALLVSLSPVLSGSRVIAAAGMAANWSAPWLFALAVTHRWSLTLSAILLARRYETNPEEEIAELSQVLLQNSAWEREK